MGASSKAVVEGVLGHASASQVKTVQRCARKWRLEKVECIPVPSTGSQNLGTAVHGQAERYQLDGTPPDHGSLIKALPSLPPVGSCLVEVPLEDPVLYPAGVRYKGFIDLLDARAVEAGRVGIWDYKTTGDFRYALKPDDLARDVQMLSYAKWASERYLGAHTFSLTHAYLRTKGAPAFKLVATEVDRATVREYWEDAIVPAVERMKAIAALPDWHDAEPNYAACGDYGGCPYRTTCGTGSALWTEPGTQTGTATLGELMGQTSVSPPPATSDRPPDAAPPPFTTRPDFTTVTLHGGSMSDPTATKASTMDSTQPGLHLYVDALPTKGVGGALVDLALIIAERAAPICARFKVSDVREVDFGKGTAQLVASFRNNPPTGVVLARTGGLSTLVLEALEPLAVTVVRGVN